MKTRDQINERVKHIDGTFPGVAGPTHMLAIVVELLLDIRSQLEELLKAEDAK
ncbi:MAG TPA: hypothetical protein VMA75_00480 [Candidatus Paceibacterota bacterium]|nr:hypothetical protein [Candidatus Paceibacterota bacterium]